MDMPANLDILITNDDGYTSKGIAELVSCMRQFGRITVVAPKYPQSGMSVALTLGRKAIAYRKVREGDGVSWSYVDGTPASCVKFALDQIYPDRKCDVVVCGINHGSNASVATNYSGTMGAAEEAAINGIPAIGVSLCDYSDDANFSKVTGAFPGIFMDLMEHVRPGSGICYNVNFPSAAVPLRGVRICHEGLGYWTRELDPWDLDEIPGGKEEGESLYVMRGRFVDCAPAGDRSADHHALEDGYISITPQTFDRTDRTEELRLSALMDKDF